MSRNLAKMHSLSDQCLNLEIVILVRHPPPSHGSNDSRDIAVGGEGSSGFRVQKTLIIGVDSTLRGATINTCFKVLA